jgi:hypothetical protein
MNSVTSRTEHDGKARRAAGLFVKEAHVPSMLLRVAKRVLPRRIAAPRHPGVAQRASDTSPPDERALPVRALTRVRCPRARSAQLRFRQGDVAARNAVRLRPVVGEDLIQLGNVRAQLAASLSCVLCGIARRRYHRLRTRAETVAIRPITRFTASRLGHLMMFGSQRPATRPRERLRTREQYEDSNSM